MPVGPFPNFDACVVAMKKTHDEESSKKICSAMERGMSEKTAKRLYSLTEPVYFVVKLGEYSEEMEVEILTTAKQTDARYGDFRFKKEELDEMVRNFNSDIVGTPIAVDLNHDPDHIALAWIKEGSMRVGESQKISGEYSLYATINNFTPRGEEMVRTGAVKLFSVEVQHKFEKFVGKAKKVFNNVIRGLALTNRPVIKDMAPTFSEKNLSTNSTNMNLETFKLLAEQLLAKAKVTADDVIVLKSFAEKLSEEDKEEANAEVEKAEEKVTEVAEAEQAEADQAEAEAKAKEEADKALAEKGKSSFTLAEVQEIVKTALKEPMQKMTEVYASARKATLSGSVNSLMLSQDRNVGIKPAAKDKVLAFVTKLSDELAKEYFALHKDIITSVDFAEHGSAGAGERKLADPEKAAQKITEMTDKLVKEDKMKFTEALLKVRAENKELADKADELVKS